jgi:CxxC-x17-CxxC domain-containing protein
VISADKTLHCRDCSQEFLWTAGEQQFFAAKGLVNQPTRCPSCRTVRRQTLGAEAESLPPRARVAYPVTCAECGCTTTVPFVPRGDRPVYCSTCFDKQRASVA